MIFRYKIPTEKESSNEIKFKVYLNYLKSIGDIFHDLNITADKTHLKSIVKSKYFIGIQKKSHNEKKIQLLLRNAWITEMQLTFTADYPTLGYSNHWASIQLYYSIYLGLYALHLAMNNVSDSDNYDGHASILKKTSEKIKNCPDLFPYPWNVTYSGDTNIDKENIILNNWDEPVLLKSTHHLSSNQENLVNFARFLKTTRKKQLEEKRRKWLKDDKTGKKNLPSLIRKKHMRELPPTTLFDCLYRLRIKANYRDIEAFLGALHIEKWAIDFNTALIEISKTSLLIIELLISKYMGKENFEKLVVDFKQYSKNIDHSVSERWELLKTLW